MLFLFCLSLSRILLWESNSFIKESDPSVRILRLGTENFYKPKIKFLFVKQSTLHLEGIHKKLLKLRKKQEKKRNNKEEPKK